MDATKQVSDRVHELNSLLAKTLRVAIQDGRSFVGTFACIDREKNIVLSSTDEYPPPPSPDGPRFVGLIMVPWRYVVSVEMEVTLGQDSDPYT
ncbi:unnamed protein product [Rhizoctonia solani]|uniref:Sm domain-containing protein n=1 Tax=Rhizoctonia solani TaxID=456999 RepID=A0A8H3HGP4_9AGAM|nr:unnamed protein product [Rhizoctonia solani]CAE6507471.1 unnamed protein product [Rhizoctonia solani]